MNKNKYVDEIEELNATDTMERQTKKKSSRQTFKTLFIIILFILCVLGVTRIVKLHKEAANTLTERPQVNSVMPRKMPLLNATKSLTNAPASYIEIAEKKPTTSSLNTPVLTQTKPVEVKPEPVLEKSVDIVAPMPSAPITSILPSTPTKPVVIGYTLQDALTFKDNFSKGNSCETDYQKLLVSPYKTQAMQNVLNNLSPYCSSQADALANIRTIFLKNKKQALIAGYKANSPKWIAYIKAILVSTVEIRKLNPKTSKPKDIIYKAQNELYRKNVYQAEKLLRTLPAVMQEQMTDFFREADIFIRANNSLNELILSFDKKGE